MSSTILRLPKAFLATLIVVLLFTSRIALPVIEASEYGDEIAVNDSDFNVKVEVLNASTNRACTFQDPAKLTYFYKPSTNLDKVFKKTDLIVFTRDDEPEMARAKASGKYPVLQYIKFDAVHDPCGQIYKAKGTPCSCSKDTFNNNVGWQPGDICDIRDNHSDWFLRDKDGKVIVINNYVVMDPGNAGWRNFWLSRLKISQPDGWHGIFMDNMGTKFFMHGKGDKALQKYTTHEAYQDAVYNFLSKVRSEYFAPNKKLMFGNITVHWGHTPYYLKMMTQLDGSMDEMWAGTKTGYYSVLSWEDRVNRARESLRQGNTVMLTTQGSRTDYNRQRFAFASYLLVVSDKAYFRYTHQDYAYDEVWMYDNYKFKLGRPLGDFRRKDNTWKRNFENGKVKVNPETRKAVIKLYIAC